jgi:hypothetical protein
VGIEEEKSQKSSIFYDFILTIFLEIFSILSYKMSNSSNSSNSGSEGNTKTSEPKPKKKQDSAKVHWCFVLNNYTEDNYTFIKNFFSSNSSNIWIIGKETGEEWWDDIEGHRHCISPAGTKHLQMYCAFKKKMRFTELKKILTSCHIQPCRGSKADNLRYCSKEGNFESNTRIPKPLKLYPPRDEWAKQVEKYALQEPDDRHVMFVSGEFCTGKTTLAKYLIGTYDFISGPLEGGLRHILSVVSDNQDVETWIMNLTGKESFSISDGDNTNLWDILEKIKDGLFMSHFGTKGTKPVNFNSPNIIIFSNCSESDITFSAEQHNFHKGRLLFTNI